MREPERLRHGLRVVLAVTEDALGLDGVLLAREVHEAARALAHGAQDGRQLGTGSGAATEQVEGDRARQRGDQRNAPPQQHACAGPLHRDSWGGGSSRTAQHGS